jgi:hypothetical protein
MLEDTPARQPKVFKNMKTHMAMSAQLLLMATLSVGCSAADSDGGLATTRNTSDPTKESYSPLAAGETQGKAETSVYGDAGAGDEATGEATSALTAAGTYDVGVIAGGSCPNPVTIYMDDEDSSNNSSLSGWVGATSSQTRFQFCRVDGSEFHRVRQSLCNSTSSESYAVLKLGTTCPNGSVEFSRYFDNEDSGNNNSNSGNIAPSTQDSGGTRLTFCGFLASTFLTKCTPSPVPELKNFPILGFAYGVFGSQYVPTAFESGQIYTDDEDSSNSNNWDLSQVDSRDVSAIQRFMSGDSNTQLSIARVGDQCNGTPGNWAGCAGNGCSVCAEKMTDYPYYFSHHRHCQKNTTCVGKYYTCNANCPAPTDADKTY